MGLLDDQRQPSGGLLSDFTEYLRRSGRNLSELPGGVVDWLAGGARAGAEPTLALMRGDAINEPLLPNASSGGRLGAVASALGSTLMPVGAPAGALGAGPVVRGANAALDMSPEARAARAAEMGYDIDAYHGTLHGDIGSEFWPETHFGTAGAARDRLNHLAWGSPDRDPVIHPERGAEAPATYPVKLRVNKPLVTPDLNDWTPASLRSELYKRGMLIDPELIPKLRGRGMFSDAELDALAAGWDDPVGFLRSQGYDALSYTNRFEGKGSQSYMMLDPSGVRSRFAAFDPARANDPDLLAAQTPYPVGLLGPDEDKRKRRDR